MGDRHLVTVPQGVVGDRLPWGGERQGGGGGKHCFSRVFVAMTQVIWTTSQGARARYGRVQGTVGVSTVSCWHLGAPETSRGQVGGGLGLGPTKKDP